MSAKRKGGDVPKPVLELSTDRPADDDAEGWRRRAEELERELAVCLTREVAAGLANAGQEPMRLWTELARFWKRLLRVTLGRENAAKRKAKREARDAEIGNYAISLARGSSLADNPKELVGRVMNRYPDLKRSTIRRILSEQHVASRIRR